MLRWIVDRIVRNADETRLNIENERLLKTYGVENVPSSELFSKIIETFEGMSEERWLPLADDLLEGFEQRLISAKCNSGDIPPKHAANEELRDFIAEVTVGLKQTLQDDVSENYGAMYKLFQAVKKENLYSSVCSSTVNAFVTRLVLRAVELLSSYSDDLSHADRDWRMANPDISKMFPSLTEYNTEYQ